MSENKDQNFDPFKTPLKESTEETHSENPEKPSLQTVKASLESKPEDKAKVIDVAPAGTQNERKPKGRLEKKFKKSVFILRQSYRAQAHFWILVALCSILFTFPEGLINLAFTKADLAASPEWLNAKSMAKGLTYIGYIGFTWALIKIWYQRVLYKYEIDVDIIKTYYGLFSRDNSTIQYADTRNTKVRKTFLGLIFNFGNIELFTAGSGDSEILIKGIANPDKVGAELERRIKASKLESA